MIPHIKPVSAKIIQVLALFNSMIALQKVAFQLIGDFPLQALEAGLQGAFHNIFL
jgi:hypothetical protein